MSSIFLRYLSDTWDLRQQQQQQQLEAVHSEGKSFETTGAFVKRPDSASRPGHLIILAADAAMLL
jgi:hypothetical protein